MVVTDSDIADFHRSMSEYEYSDVKTAIKKFQEVEMDPNDLADAVREFHEDTGIPIKDVDVCNVAFDHILQMARIKIDKVLYFDIRNDIKDSEGFYTAGNFMRTSFDCSQEATDQLEEKLKDAVTEQIEELLDDIFVKVFLEDVEINIEEIRKTGSEKQEVVN